MKKLLLLLLSGIFAFQAFAQDNYQPAEANIAARKDFQDRKFGLFVHWGVYSILGDGEWVMHNEQIPYKDYSKLPAFFYPYAFNAKEWVAMAKAAGMKYITITSRHHDGFSMFGTKATPYNIVDATPWGKDPMKALAEECHKQGIKLFFYYSLLDWGRPDYAFGSPIVNGKPQGEGADWDHYINFMKQQLTELLTNYGPIGGIWFDGEWERYKADWHFDEIYSLIHKLQPQALIINNHHHAPRAGEDVQEFERDLPGNNTAGFNENEEVGQLPLETCQTMNNSWGFTIKDNHYKSTKDIIHFLVNDAGRNSNLLLNVGPMPNGKVQPAFVDTLKEVGKWMDQYGGSIYGTRGGFVPPKSWGVTTERNDTQFVHILHLPAEKILFLPHIKGKVKMAKLFGTEQAIKYKQTADGLMLYLDELDPSAIDNIVELKVTGLN